jgi:hypothetical protein
MSALPPKADIVQHGGNVRFVPIADILPRRAVRLSEGGVADAMLPDYEPFANRALFERVG